MISVTCTGPCNIAVHKYWGKRCEDINLPLNGSICATLEHMTAKTTVMASPKFKEDRMWLNGVEIKMDNPKLLNVIQTMRKRGQVPEEVKAWKIHICSENNFPTAAGLASSAAGYAALAFNLAKLYKVEGDISEVARMGSGSACRGVYGGFVRWYMGSDPSGCDSISKQIAPSSHWPEMRILNLIVNENRKKISSTLGMTMCVTTSQFMKCRAEEVVPPRLDRMEKAILQRDYQTFSEILMKDSNNMHAVCLDSYPPCVYMNDVSLFIVDLVHAFNEVAGRNRAGYTYDAGPNATIYLLEQNVEDFLGLVDYYLPPAKAALIDSRYHRGMQVQPVTPSEQMVKRINLEKQPAGKLNHTILTRVSDGPRYLPDNESLLDNEGLPITTYKNGI